ncbi:MAG: response regulator, partial [Deltaproteobacteria bacterium]|nr:response regulator [Deltaproteobacteria bacterium]
FRSPTGHPDSLQDDIEQIRVAGGRAKDLVQQILAFSGRGAQRPEYTDLRAIVEETLDLIRASFPAPTELESSISEYSCTVYADPSHIHQVVMNLMINAGQSLTIGEGTLSVSVEPVHLDASPERAIIPIEAGDYVRVTVADTGCGISEEHQARVFEPFFSTKANVSAGSGMGLAAVHGIVGSYKGTVTLQSTLGEGTVFEVYLPRAHGKVSAKSMREIANIGSFEAHILLVDDEPLAVEMLKQMLEKLGCQVETAVDGVEALAAVRSDPERFDMVLTDHAMPRMTGYMLARELESLRSDLPVLLCSGYNEKVLGLPTSGGPVRAFLRKPISLTELSSALGRCLP